MSKFTVERMEGMKSTAEVRRFCMGLIEEVERLKTEKDELLETLLHFSEEFKDDEIPQFVKDALKKPWER